MMVNCSSTVIDLAPGKWHYIMMTFDLGVKRCHPRYLAHANDYLSSLRQYFISILLYFVKLILLFSYLKKKRKKKEADLLVINKLTKMAEHF